MKKVLNADKTGLFWRALAEMLLSVKKRQFQMGKNSKQRIIVLLLVNGLREKEGPNIIDKSQQPRILSNLKSRKDAVGWIESEF